MILSISGEVISHQYLSRKLCESCEHELFLHRDLSNARFATITPYNVTHICLLKTRSSLLLNKTMLVLSTRDGDDLVFEYDSFAALNELGTYRYHLRPVAYRLLDLFKKLETEAIDHVQLKELYLTSLEKNSLISYLLTDYWNFHSDFKLHGEFKIRNYLRSIKGKGLSSQKTSSLILNKNDLMGIKKIYPGSNSVDFEKESCPSFLSRRQRYALWNKVTNLTLPTDQMGFSSKHVKEVIFDLYDFDRLKMRENLCRSTLTIEELKTPYIQAAIWLNQLGLEISYH